MAEYKSAYTGPQIDAAIGAVAGKQDTLVSGTNIKTINNESLLGSGNITIEGGGSDVSVREIDYSNPEEWDSGEDQPTTAVIDDILANKYTLIHVYNIEINEGVMVEMYIVSSGMIDVEETGTARYYYKFDEGDEDEGTSPNIEQYLFTHQEGESAQMIVETFALGEMNNIAVYSANFDMSQGSPTLTQEDMANIWTNKPDIIRLTAGTTTTVGNKSREDSDTAQVIYSSTVMEGTTPTVYIITITYDEPNSQYVFDMDTYVLSTSA